MRFDPTRLAGPLIIVPQVHGDERGFFLESYVEAGYRAGGVTVNFVQDNHSRSVRGTVRGLHFQSSPGQAKLVHCARGAVRDVIVDIRRSSPTFGQHDIVELDDVGHRQLFVPVGFAHGFAVLSDVADVVYKVSSPFDPATEAGIAWDDPALGIDWGIRDALVSDRDRGNPTLEDARSALPAW